MLIFYGGSTPLRWTTVLANVVFLLFLLIIFVCCNVFFCRKKRKGRGLISIGGPALLWPLLGPMFPIVPVWRGATLALPENDDDGVL